MIALQVAGSQVGRTCGDHAALPVVTEGRVPVNAELRSLKPQLDRRFLVIVGVTCILERLVESAGRGTTKSRAQGCTGLHVGGGGER